MRLTQRDEAILAYLGNRRAATLPQLERKFFPSYRTAARRLQLLTQARYLKRNPLPLGESWASVFSLSSQGRRMAAAIMDVEQVPQVEIDIRIRHVLAVNEALDELGLDGQTEVPVGGVIADAVCPGPLYVEVDRGNGDLRTKARRYGTLGPLLIVTPRPQVAQEAFSKHGDVLVIDEASLYHDGIAESVRRELEAVGA